jgi:ATP-dependent Clp protease protease subunit
MSKRVSRDEIDRFHDYSLYMPTRTIYIGSEAYDGEGGESGVDGLMAERLVKNISILDSLSQDPIIIIMNNPGGDWYHGIAIYDAIKSAKSHVTIKIYGMAMSMGAVILQAADERLLAPSAKIMIHYGEMGLGSVHSKVFDKWSDENKRLNEDMETIFLAKIQEKQPKYKLKKLKQLLNFDTILTAQEAISLGLADKILGEEANE